MQKINVYTHSFFSFLPWLSSSRNAIDTHARCFCVVLNKGPSKTKIVFLNNYFQGNHCDSLPNAFYRSPEKCQSSPPILNSHLFKKKKKRIVIPSNRFVLSSRFKSCSKSNLFFLLPTFRGSPKQQAEALDLPLFYQRQFEAFYIIIISLSSPSLYKHRNKLFIFFFCLWIIGRPFTN